MPAKNGCVTCSGSDQLLELTLVNLADTLHDICQRNEEIKFQSFSQRKHRKKRLCMEVATFEKVC